MNIDKWVAFRIFFVLEVLAFVAIYVNGSHGLRVVHMLESENVRIEQENVLLVQAVVDQEQQLAQWAGKDFLKERFAREQLQMARKGDEIYYLT